MYICHTHKSFFFFFLAASRVGKNCQTYKCREDRFFWINFNENAQGTVTSFSSFQNLNHFLHSFWLILAVTITIGYKSNREADKRWSKIDGTWCWTNQVANSSGGKSLFLGILLYVLTMKLYSQGIILDSLFIFLALNFLLLSLLLLFLDGWCNLVLIGWNVWTMLLNNFLVMYMYLLNYKCLCMEKFRANISLVTLGVYHNLVYALHFQQDIWSS